MTKRPPAVRLACWLLWFMVGAGLLVCVLVVVERDELGSVWSPMQVGDSTVQPVEFVPVILVLYGVVGSLALTLVALFRAGLNWARHSLAAISAGVVVMAIATVRTNPPTLVDGISIAAAVIGAVTLVFLWHPQSRDYVHSFSPRAIREAAARDAAEDTGEDAAEEGAGDAERPAEQPAEASATEAPTDS